MRSHEIARRYANALYQLAAEEGAVEATQDELRSVVDEIDQVGGLTEYLTHPLVSREEKAELVRRAFPQLSERMRRLLSLLIRNRREAYLDLIYAEYVDARTASEGLVTVRVTTARPLNEEQRTRLIDHLERGMDRRVRLEEVVDERLLGGARIETEGRVVDGTVRARLNGLRARLQT